MAKKAEVVVKKTVGVPPYRAEWDDSDVRPIQEALEDVIGKLGGIRKFVKSGSKVLLKPNLVCAEPPETANGTDPRVIQALIKICKDAGATAVTVGDHPMGAEVPEVTGMTRACVDIAATEAVNLYDGEYVSKDLEGYVLKKADVPKLYYDVDCVINVAKMKTHLACVVTLAMKNMMGLLPFPSWIPYHKDNLYDAIVDVNLLFPPALNIVDGIIAQEGHAPMYGFPVPDMNTIVAGVDPFATDLVAAKIMGVDTIESPVIRAARLRGEGITDLREIQVVGDRIEDVERKFLPAVPHPIGYSRWDGLSYPFEIYSGGTCVAGCHCMAREALDMLTVWCANKKVPEERKKKLIFIMGGCADVPEKLPEDAAVFVIGDCAKAHQDRGIFCGGCLCDAGILYGNIGQECIGEPVDHPFNSATREHLERYLKQ